MGKYGKTITDSYQEVLGWKNNTQELLEKKKVSKREIDKLEDDNEHGMVALKLAQSFGTPKEVKTVQDINKRHNRAGSIEHKDQKERDAIIRKYYNMAEEVELKEMNPTDHVKKKGDKYCVYNADGSIAKEFDNEEDANKYAIDNHDKLMNEEEKLDEGAFWGQDKMVKFFKDADKKKGLVQLKKSTGSSTSMTVTVKAKDIKKYEKQGFELDPYFDDMREEVELDEKYDLYHKTFSDAMKHAVDYAKSKMGITVDPKEIDDKVATGPKKPSDGKTNKYRLKGKGGTLQIQVYNKGGSKPFELNMYKEEVELDERKLTDAELKKREEIAKAIEKENPNMPMDKKMAIATATAKKVSEEGEGDPKKTTRIAQLKLQIAKANEILQRLTDKGEK